jgi:stage II sporulation protein D
MKYLWILFGLLFICSALAVFVLFAAAADDKTKEAETEIEIAIEIATETETETEIESGIAEGAKSTESPLLKENGTDGKTQIFISVLNAKTGEVLIVCLEEYLIGVVISEMPPSFEPEALKAQAVAARSYCVYKMLRLPDEAREKHSGADICTDFRCCKNYTSYEEAAERFGAESIGYYWGKIKNAVDATKNEIITYESEPAIAVFHAIAGNRTESAENVWGNNVPYLVSVPSAEHDEGRRSEVRNYITENIFCESEFKKLLLANGFDGAGFAPDASLWLGEITRNSSGRVDSLIICGEVIAGRRLREIFSLRSTDFILEYKNSGFVFTVTGYGHGVGMSQYGANLMARDGMDYTEILTWYYTGVEIRRDWNTQEK